MIYQLNAEDAPVQGARPPKIRSNVTIHNFRKLKPRVLRSKGVPPAQPTPSIKRRATKPAPMPPQPRPIEIKIPKAPPKQIKRQPAPEAQPQLIPQLKPIRVDLEAPKRSLLRQQLSELRKQALQRGQNVNKQHKGMQGARSAPTIHRTKPPINRKAIEGLKNLGVNRILVMVAAGPSVLEVDLKSFLNHPVIDMMCINKPMLDIWPTKFWAFCDHTQYRANQDIWNHYDGIILNSPNVRARKPNQIMIRTKSGAGFSKNLQQGYHIGRSSTYAAMQVAYYMSYRKVFIYGCDMTEVGGKLHHYGQNPDVSNDSRKSRFPAEAKHYLWAGQNLEKAERERFIFCSAYNPWEFLKYFTKWDHRDAADKILKIAEDIQRGK